uniref:SpoVT-AbrB domain-containing protein n=1 Tax=uncultured bacterium A1Q1_fos_1246 TaxID=1256545 RepID=L7VYR2_9BACT|nr:hypothetical protein [uncultured bacterium A1Q1_fos_1246]
MKMNIQVAQQGKLTLPKNLRDIYAIKSGDIAVNRLRFFWSR